MKRKLNFLDSSFTTENQKKKARLSSEHETDKKIVTLSLSDTVDLVEIFRSTSQYWNNNQWLHFLSFANAKWNAFDRFQDININEKILCNIENALLRKQYLIFLNNCKFFYPLNDEKFNILKVFCLEEDSRVRMEALGIFVFLLKELELELINGNSENIISLSYQEKLLQIASQLIDDLYPYVRVRAVELLVVISHINRLYLEGEIDAPSESYSDKIFCLICDKIRDTDVSVRTRATRLLGSLHYAKRSLLFDTFDKMKLDYSRKDSKSRDKQPPPHTAQRSAIAVNAKSEIGHKTTIDEFQAELDITTVLNERDDTILSDTAVGALVLALEDEYQSVRMAAVAAICDISKYVDQFSKLAIDFVIEMFNDEIDAVRIFAIETVSKIGAISFNEDQIHIALTLLEDGSFDIRQSVRYFLSNVTLASTTCLQAAFLACYSCLRKYPQDEWPILCTLQQLGKNHSHYTAMIMEELLHLERYILKPKMVIDDQYHICVMILICNSVIQKNGEITVGVPAIFSILPEYIYEHYQELKYKTKYGSLFPTFCVRKLTPKLMFGEVAEPSGRLSNIVAVPSKPTVENTNIVTTGMDLISLFINAQNGQKWSEKFAEANTGGIYTEISTYIRNILKQIKIRNTHSDCGTVRKIFLLQFSKCILKYISLLNHWKLNSHSLRTSRRMHAQLCSQCCTLNYGTYLIQNRFLNLSPALILQLKMLRLSIIVLCTLNGFFLLHDNHDWNIRVSKIIKDQILAINDEANKPKTLQELPQSILSTLSNLVTISKQTCTDTSSLKECVQFLSQSHMYLSSYFPIIHESMFDEGFCSEYIDIQITNPLSELEKPQEFLCYIPMHLEVKMVSTCPLSEEFIASRLRVVAELPDSTEQWFPMKLDIEASNMENGTDRKEVKRSESSQDGLSNTAVNKITKSRHILSELNIEMSNWSNSSTIRLKPTLLYDTDIIDEYRLILVHSIGYTWTELDNSQCFEVADIATYREHTLPISKKTTQLLIHPHT